MYSLAKKISEILTPFIKETFDVSISQFDFQSTRKEFEGDITLVTFSLLKFIKTNPAKLSNQIGEFLKTRSELVSDFNVVKGFLNLSIKDRYYVDALNQISKAKYYGHRKQYSNKTILIEYSSPNTNKPCLLYTSPSPRDS